MTTWQDVLRPGDAHDFFSRVAMPAFNPATSDYDEGNALWLAELSRLVYRHDTEESNPPPLPTRSSFLAKVGLRQRRFFLCARTDTQVMLVTSGSPPEFAVLVFRGTDSQHDRITDLNVGLQFLAFHRPGLHRGFRKALDSVWPEIEAELATLDCPVFYTGHSLGGALATLAAARRAPNRAVYTFGSPRVGNLAFARALRHLPIHRVVDDIDIVAMVPPALLGFAHVGRAVRLRATRGNGTVKPLAWRHRPPALLADHAPVNYIDRMPTAREPIELASKTV